MAKRAAAAKPVSPDQSHDGTTAARKPGRDASDLDPRGPERRAPGAAIADSGSSVAVETGDSRTLVPELATEKCDGCTLCYFYCPDASIVVEGGKAVAVDLALCKGCGICARECPTGAIVMRLDAKE